MDQLSKWLQIIFAVLPLLKPTEDGRRRRQRNRRYKEIKQLRKKRDKGRLTPDQYAEALAEIERKYPDL